MRLVASEPESAAFSRSWTGFHWTGPTGQRVPVTGAMRTLVRFRPRAAARSGDDGKGHVPQQISGGCSPSEKPVRFWL